MYPIGPDGQPDLTAPFIRLDRHKGTKDGRSLSILSVVASANFHFLSTQYARIYGPEVGDLLRNVHTRRHKAIEAFFVVLGTDATGAEVEYMALQRNKRYDLLDAAASRLQTEILQEQGAAGRAPNVISWAERLSFLEDLDTDDDEKPAKRQKTGKQPPSLKNKGGAAPPLAKPGARTGAAAAAAVAAPKVEGAQPPADIVEEVCLRSAAFRSESGSFQLVAPADCKGPRTDLILPFYKYRAEVHIFPEYNRIQLYKGDVPQLANASKGVVFLKGVRLFRPRLTHGLAWAFNLFSSGL